MASGDGIKPEGTADKSLGEIVVEVSDKATLLVREEIELAKAEIQTKVTRLGKAAAVGAAAGVFVLFALYMLLFAIGFVIVDIFNFQTTVWPGFLIGTGLFLVFAAIAGFVAYRFVKAGAPPTPDLAIEEAKETRRAIEGVRR